MPARAHHDQLCLLSPACARLVDRVTASGVAKFRDPGIANVETLAVGSY